MLPVRRFAYAGPFPAFVPTVNPPVQTEVMTARRSPALSVVFQNWQFLILAALTLWLYWHTLVRLFLQWGNDKNFSHGYFVPLFSGFVIWQERDRLTRIKLRPSWSGLLLVVLGLVVLILGQMGVELFLMRSSLLILAA